MGSSFIQVLTVFSSFRGSARSKGESAAVERSGAAVPAAVLGGSAGAGEAEPEDEEQRDFDDPLCTLVKNCNVLHNIVGPACIFLRQGFAQSQLVCI